MESCDGNNIISPFFFKEPTVTGETLLAMMDTVLFHIPVRAVLQLHGVPPHCSHHVCVFTDREFPDHWIRRWGTIPCSPHSPDDPHRFFSFEGFVKDIYPGKVQNVNELCEQIVRAADKVLANTWCETAAKVLANIW